MQVGAADTAAAEAEQRAGAADAARAEAVARCQLAERESAAARWDLVALQQQVRAAAQHIVIFCQV